VDGVKMSKSLGNFVTIKDALKQYHPEALRLFILSGLYRSPADYSPAALDAATKGAERINTAARRVRTALKTAKLGDAANNDRLITLLDQYHMRFTSAMNDDFNAPLALSALFDMSKDLNTAIDESTASLAVLERADSMYNELGGQVLGIIQSDATTASNSSNAEREAGLIQMLIDMRLEARKTKDFARADGIRNQLSKIGVILEDGPNGTTYRISSN
jgi:cysteinyl-tRNA synthetase